MGNLLLQSVRGLGHCSELRILASYIKTAALSSLFSGWFSASVKILFFTVHALMYLYFDRELTTLWNVHFTST